ncbi:MAG: flagellin lysine-N-methylase [Eubacteriales bacterium]|nr:flagellin lysine-N-methylase [Eubacteriales bacterium]
MRIYAPSYYKEFSCKADRCRNNCCIGWEIDIDPETYDYYQSVGGQMGDRFNKSIVHGEDPHFILTEGDRCPFLNKDNLCDIITSLGEDKLCEICAQHPRYRNFFEEYIEVGIGMSCEEGARIILNCKDKVKLSLIESNGEKELYNIDEVDLLDLRDDILDIVQDRNFLVEQRLERLHDAFEISLPNMTISQWAGQLFTLEVLDPVWEKYLKVLMNVEEEELDFAGWDIAFEQILVYFILRHLSDGMYDDRYKQRIAFALVSLKLIKAVWQYCLKDLTMENLQEAARLYSSEIEYSQNNTESMLEILE